MDSPVFPWNLLVLGHQGFIGKEIRHYLSGVPSEFFTIQERLQDSNLESLLKGQVTNRTIVVNCIASGVTPSTGNWEVDLQTNFELVRKLCSYSLSLGAHGFIHFASNYELQKHVQPLASRLNYVSTKSKGSAYCLEQIQLGRNVRLSYLPTVMGLNQPKGRFFRDFLTHLEEQRPFQINYPTAEIELITVPSLIKKLDLLNPSMDWGVQEVDEDLRISVLGLAQILNEILEELGEKQLDLRDASMSSISNENRIREGIPDEFRKFLVDQLSRALGESNG